MPARNVIRPTLANRFSNTPASNPATINAAQLNQGAPNATAQTGSSPVAATRSTPQGFQGTGNVATVQMPQSEDVSFITPSGAKGIIQLSSNGKAKITSNPQYTKPITQNGKVIGTGIFDTAIVNDAITSELIGFKGNTLAEPINTTTNTSIGTLTEKGTINYQYALQGSELVPEVTSTTGGIFYQSPRSAQQYSAASAANAAAKSNINEFHSLENITIPSLTQQMNTAFAQGNRSYGIALSQELQYDTMFANQLLANPIYSKGEFAGYGATGLLSASQTVMNNNKPVEVAKLTTSGLMPLATTVSDALYGTVNGKNQNLGTLSFTPTVTNGTFSLSYSGFKPSIVQIGGQGWNAGLYSSYNPVTGQLSLNPKNYAYVSGNLITQNGSNGEVIKTITMPSGFGIQGSFGNLNYENIANIPVTNGKYSGLESYTSFGGSGKYSLQYAGTFPLTDVTTISLGNGITETEKATRQFNPLTGAITYSNSSTFAIPGLGSVAVPSTAALSETYNYKGKQYTFSFSPANSKYSITPQATPTALFTISKNTWKAPEAWNSGAPSQSIEYLFGNGGVAGYNILNSVGSVIGGGTYATPKTISEGNVKQPTLTGNTLILPASEYASYIQSATATTKASEINAGIQAQYSIIQAFNAKQPFGSIVNDIQNVYNPAWAAYTGGELTGAGYPLKGLESLGKGFAEASAPVFITIAPVAAATGATISGSAQIATNIASGRPILNNVGVAASLGADFGGVFGATLPAGTSAINVAKTVGINAVKMGVIFGAFESVSSDAELAFGGQASQTSGMPSNTRGTAMQSQGSTGKSQSFSLLSDYTPSEYLNVGVSSFLEGFTTGTEFAGGLGAIGNILGSSSSATAKTVIQLMQNKPLVSGAMGTIGFTGTLLSGGTPRQALVSGLTSGAFMYGFMGLSEQFNPQLKLGTAGEPSTAMATRPGPAEEGSGTIITGNDEGTGLMRTNQYGSQEYLKAVNTPYKNGNILDVGTGAIRTLTGEATETAPEVSDIFSGQMKVDRTVTINPTRIQRLFGIGPKVMTSSFFTPTPEAVSTMLSENPAIVVSQPGGIETTPELSDVYNTAGIKPEGPTTIFHESIATPQGQEWLGETGNTEGFNFVGKTSKFVMLEVGPNDALPSAEDLFAGRPGEMEASPYEGPKAASEMKPFDLGLESLGKIESPISSEPTIETGNGEVQVQTTKTIPKTAQTGAASSIFSARMPAYVNTESDVVNVFPLATLPSSASSSAIFQPKSIFKTPTIAPTQKQVSISGVDPYALAAQISTTQLINGSANTQKQASITNINRHSNLNPLGNMLYSSSRSNLLFGSRVGLSNKTSYGVSTKVSQKQSQKQTQKQSQKQSQKNAYKNPPPTITPPPISDYLYGAFAPDQRIKPPKPKAQKPATPQKGTFKYINDLTSAMFNIHGSKKNKVYGSLGFFRPLS